MDDQLSYANQHFAKLVDQDKQLKAIAIATHKRWKNVPLTINVPVKPRIEPERGVANNNDIPASEVLAELTATRLTQK
jgi:hypothetical protein